MSVEAAQGLEQVIRQSGEGWLIDWFSPPENAISRIQETLQQVHQLARDRLGRNAPDLTEAALLNEYVRNPLKIRGFFQAIGSSGTPEMLLMAWRIIQGMKLKAINVSYERQQSFVLRIVLESPDDTEGENYESSTIADFKLLRHLGIMMINDAPVFEGFYPLKLERT